MALSKDGEDRLLTSNLVSSLQALLRSTPNRDWLEYQNKQQLLQQLDKLSKIVGSMKEMDTITDTEPTQGTVGEDNTSLNGDALEQLSIKIVKEMLQSVRSHIRANGFPEKARIPVVSAQVSLPASEDIVLTIRLSIEKVSSV